MRNKWLIVLLCFSSCSIDMGESGVVDEKDSMIPDSVLSEFSHSEISEGVVQFLINSEHAEIYNALDVLYLTNLSFFEFDSEGNVKTKGQADEVYFYTNSENAELIGDINFYSAVEDTWIQTDYLVWNKDLQQLSTNPETSVFLDKKDDYTISGKGFEADLKTKSISFNSSVNGVYSLEDEEEE